ncbi:Serine/threonine-protein phosphatase 7 long form like [Apostasia shenzhenica]|uniref:Serine/threonine-protein phosphatase 7 long form like n=1 Tax=Apostasia shenzhenica TaxID=1088818 RepID=A0A2I0AAT2_9ASPA|nr:Serine/threonine-protein phosphatase 7 long form like [Apostasia shenzhenica]
MSTHVEVTLMLHYDGKLLLEGDVPRYEGGRRKPIKVPIKSSLDELKGIVYNALKYNPEEFHLNLVCKFPSRDVVAVNVEDDNDCFIMLEHCAGGPVSLYVEKQSATRTVVTFAPRVGYTNVGDDSMHNRNLPQIRVNRVNGITGVRKQGRDRNSEYHRSRHPEAPLLESRCHFKEAIKWPVNDERLKKHIDDAGFGEVRKLQWLRLDRELITALVERWCTSTNTFHFVHGEMTVTLQDVAIILGLRIDGPAIVTKNMVGPCCRWAKWSDMCDELLGKHPDPQDGWNMGQANSCVPLNWLRTKFAQVDLRGLSDQEVIYQVRAYILHFIGAALMPDTSGNEVHCKYLPLLEHFDLCGQLSWGSATLSCLYRELYRATDARKKKIAGCLHLLQLWSWEHHHVGRPMEVPKLNGYQDAPLGCRWNAWMGREAPMGWLQFYRNEFDTQQRSQMEWQPYTEEILRCLPKICSDGKSIWMARVPLICFGLVEWHVPDRVFRQFGIQHVTAEPLQENKRVDGRGLSHVDWTLHHAIYIMAWNDRHEKVVKAMELEMDEETAMAQYIMWYRSQSSPYILQPPNKSPTTYYPRGHIERELIKGHRQIRALLAPLKGESTQSDWLSAQAQVLELQDKLMTRLQIDDFNLEERAGKFPTRHAPSEQICETELTTHQGSAAPLQFASRHRRRRSLSQAFAIQHVTPTLNTAPDPGLERPPRRRKE